MKTKEIKYIDLDESKLVLLRERIKKRELVDEDYDFYLDALDSICTYTALIKDKKNTINRLRAMLFGAKTESRSNLGKTLLKQAEATIEAKSAAEVIDLAATKDEMSPKVDSTIKQKKKGHGRNGAAAYTGAERNIIPLSGLKKGQPCPKCLGQGSKLYDNVVPGVLIRLHGQPPVGCTIHLLEKLRCNICGEIFTAVPPEDIGTETYAPSVATIIGVLKYGSGFPFNRLARIQQDFGIPLPASTQWKLVAEQANRAIKPAFKEMERQAADGGLMHNDDTGAVVLELLPKSEEKSAAEKPQPQEGEKGEKTTEKSTHKGVFTTSILSVFETYTIALFYTGNNHAGINLNTLLKLRTSTLSFPLLMCDALDRNVPKDFLVDLCNCLTHGRRKFVEVAPEFMEECLHVIELLAQVYRNDKFTNEQKLSPEERLIYHQTNSASIMEKLHDYITDQLKSKKVEPNSGLGCAMQYMLNHWDKLTRFLHVAGAPLDNNVCERALKMAILHRKNALFYKTMNGARVGDMYMSIIQTCRLCHVDPYRYILALDENCDLVKANPAAWMPWNYHEALAEKIPKIPNAA